MRSSMEQQSPSAHMKATDRPGSPIHLLAIPCHSALSTSQYLLEADQAKRTCFAWRRASKALCKKRITGRSGRHSEFSTLDAIAVSMPNQTPSWAVSTAVHNRRFPAHSRSNPRLVGAISGIFCASPSYGAAIGEAGFCDQQGYAATNGAL